MQKTVNRICPKCGSIMDTVIVKRNIEFKKSRTLCVACKEEFKKNLIARNKSTRIRDIVSKNMLEHNPVKDLATREKISDTLKLKYNNGELISCFQIPEKMKEIRSLWKITDAGRVKLSESMSANNPMKNQSSKHKRTETFNERIKNGEIVYKHGAEHHLWKGNRIFSDVVRCQLYPIWTYLILERDNFTCQSCGKAKKLQVHHLITLRSLIESVKNKYNIKFFDDLDSSLWQKYIDEILSLHKLEYGVTLCPKCHSRVDDNYKFGDKI